MRITTFLWFNNNADEAMKFYTSLFPDSSIIKITRYGDEIPEQKGKVLIGIFKLAGQEFYALDGGPQFSFTEAISLFVTCDTQEEIDRLWKELSAGGTEQVCGWLKDKFGLSWQIVPKVLDEMMQTDDQEKKNRLMQAMLKMKKLDIAGLERAFGG